MTDDIVSAVLVHPLTSYHYQYRELYSKVDKIVNQNDCLLEIDEDL